MPCGRLSLLPLPCFPSSSSAFPYRPEFNAFMHAPRSSTSQQTRSSMQDTHPSLRIQGPPVGPLRPTTASIHIEESPLRAPILFWRYGALLPQRRQILQLMQKCAGCPGALLRALPLDSSLRHGRGAVCRPVGSAALPGSVSRMVWQSSHNRRTVRRSAAGVCVAPLRVSGFQSPSSHGLSPPGVCVAPLTPVSGTGGVRCAGPPAPPPYPVHPGNRRTLHAFLIPQGGGAFVPHTVHSNAERPVRAYLTGRRGFCAPHCTFERGKTGSRISYPTRRRGFCAPHCTFDQGKTGSRIPDPTREGQITWAPNCGYLALLTDALRVRLFPPQQRGGARRQAAIVPGGAGRRAAALSARQWRPGRSPAPRCVVCFLRLSHNHATITPVAWGSLQVLAQSRQQSRPQSP